MLVAHSYYIIFSPVVKRNRQGNLCLCLREFSHIIGKNNSPQRRILGVCTLDTRPIGVFDSGLGGLTALRELSRLLPGEDIIYFGDTGRVPYGGRSRETLIRYARQDVAFLRTFDLKGIVVACGTVSTTALDVLPAFAQQSGVDAEMTKFLLRVTGIALICELAAQLCRDAGSGGLAQKVELGGKVVILCACLPLVRELSACALSLLD